MMQIISLGMGVQSTAMYLMSSLGVLPRADYAIFSDTGRESLGTYKYLDFLQNWQASNNGLSIIVLKQKSLFDDLLSSGQEKRFTSIPAFTMNDDGSVGMLRRQCTGEYKIKVVDDYIRDHIYALPKGARRPRTAVWHGITLDELERVAAPREAWKVNTYPFLGKYIDRDENLLDLSWSFLSTRRELHSWYVLHGFPIPPKSSCVFCPYQSDHSWALKKKHSPEDFEAAVKVDNAIRNSTAKGIRNPVYLHRTCRPLSDVQFDVRDSGEWGECSGNCHV